MALTIADYKVIEDLKEIEEEHQKLNGELREENEELQRRIDKANDELINLIQIINEQPSNNVEEDNYLLGKLESISNILKGDSNE